MFDLTNRTALITGSSEGIGLAIASALSRAGATIAIHGRSEDESLIAASGLKAEGRIVHALAGDLAAPGSASELAGRALALLGSIDILISSVAVQTRAPWQDTSATDVAKVVQVNFTSAFELIQALAPPMVARGWGRVLTIGSIQQARPHPQMPIYAATKAAQFNLVQNLARQHARHGVTFNNLAPGVILTGRNTEALSDEAYREQVLSAIPAGFFGEPQDLSGAALLLCSEAGRYITGQNLFVDGGMSA